MPVRIAIVGADETARAVLETLQTIDEARVVAVVAATKTDIEYSVAETLARKTKARAFRDVQTLLRTETPDALCVVATGKARRDAQNFALQNNVDIFLVPPFATSLSQAQTLLQSAAQARSRLWISHHERFSLHPRKRAKVCRRAAMRQSRASVRGSWKPKAPKARLFSHRVLD